MIRRTPYEAGGFAFSDEEAMEKAVKEAEGIRYIKKQTNMEDPQMVLQIYCQMVQQQLFETPVGYAFLYELREYLVAMPSIQKEDIPAIPVVSFKEHVAERKKNEPVQTKTKIVRKTKVQNVDYKPKFQTSFVINIILLLMIIGMFAVTATSGNINIVNYENALIEKYEGWENELNQREERLQEREKALNSLE